MGVGEAWRARHSVTELCENSFFVLEPLFGGKIVNARGDHASPLTPFRLLRCSSAHTQQQKKRKKKKKKKETRCESVTRHCRQSPESRLATTMHQNHAASLANRHTHKRGSHDSA